METITWITAGASLVGVVLNIKRQRICFLIWACTNAFWAVYDYTIGAYAQSALFGVYFFLALWGLWEWRRGCSQ